MRTSHSLNLRRALTAGAVMLLFGCARGRAQDSIPWPPENRLTVTVTPRVAIKGDTIVLSYTIANALSSEQAAQTFVLRLDVSDYRLDAPADWFANRAMVQDSAAAHWYGARKQALIPPGATLAGFVLRGMGRAALVPYRVKGYHAPPVYDDSVGTPIQRPPSFWVNSVPGHTVGLIPIPRDSTPAGLLRTVRIVLADFCGVASRADGLCTSLKAELAAASDALARGAGDAAAGAIRAFKQELESPAANALGSGVAAALQIDADQILKRLQP